jgi:carboxylesterase type B
LNHVVAYNGSLGTSLFRGAIANSPYLPPVHPFDSSIEQDKYQRFVEEAGCNTHWNTFKCLVESDTDALMKANAIVSTSGPTGTLAWGPVFPSHVLI